MAYVNWDFMATFVEGEKRLKEDVVRRGETAEVHPFFDEKEAAMRRRVDTALSKAGYDTPLDSITDADLKNAAAGILVGLLTETSSNREPWMEAAYIAGMKYLDGVAAGEITVIGVVTDTDTSDAGGATYSQLLDSPVFDDTDPDAAAPHVFPSLGYPRATNWRR